jgi:hypothetical protein
MMVISMRWKQGIVKAIFVSQITLIVLGTAKQKKFIIQNFVKVGNVFRTLKKLNMIILGVLLMLFCFYRIDFDITREGAVLLWYGHNQRESIYLFTLKK